MLKQFEIHGGVVKNLNAFLAERGIDLKTAMDAEETNKLVAAIIHEGLPGMVGRPSETPKCGFQTASLRVGTGCRRVAFC